MVSDLIEPAAVLTERTHQQAIAGGCRAQVEPSLNDGCYNYTAKKDNSLKIVRTSTLKPRNLFPVDDDGSCFQQSFSSSSQSTTADDESCLHLLPPLSQESIDSILSQDDDDEPLHNVFNDASMHKSNHPTAEETVSVQSRDVGYIKTSLKNNCGEVPSINIDFDSNAGAVNNNSSALDVAAARKETCERTSQQLFEEPKEHLRDINHEEPSLGGFSTPPRRPHQEVFARTSYTKTGDQTIKSTIKRRPSDESNDEDPPPLSKKRSSPQSNESCKNNGGQTDGVRLMGSLPEKCSPRRTSCLESYSSPSHEDCNNIASSQNENRDAMYHGEGNSSRCRTVLKSGTTANNGAKSSSSSVASSHYADKGAKNLDDIDFQHPSNTKRDNYSDISNTKNDKNLHQDPQESTRFSTSKPQDDVKKATEDFARAGFFTPPLQENQNPLACGGRVGCDDHVFTTNRSRSRFTSPTSPQESNARQERLKRIFGTSDGCPPAPMKAHLRRAPSPVWRSVEDQDVRSLAGVRGLIIQPPAGNNDIIIGNL